MKKLTSIFALLFIVSAVPAQAMFRSLNIIAAATSTLRRSPTLTRISPVSLLNLSQPKALKQCSKKFSPLIALRSLSAHSNSAKVRETIITQIEQPAGGELTVTNFDGSISIEGWDKNTISITATKEAHDKEAMENTQIQVQSEGNLTTCQTQIKIDENAFTAASEGAELTVIDESNHIFNKPVASVHYVIKIPTKTRVAIHSISGPITIKNIENAVTISTMHSTLRADNCPHVDCD